MGCITQKDIAKVFGVTAATVSKALNDSYEISSETKKRIIDYARANNFKPNPIAKKLKLGHSNTIGVIVCSINNLFVTQILEGIYEALADTFHDIIIMQSHENIENEKDCLEALVSRGVDGIIMAPVSEISNIDRIRDINENTCPVILFDRIQSDLNVTKIGVQEIKGTFEATKHLFSIGRNNILFITGDKFTDRHPRLKGYKSAYQKFDVPFNENYILTCDLANPDAMDAKITQTLTELDHLNMMPDAILGATDTITIRTLGVLAAMKIEVPKQIAVIGFCNTDNASSMNPSLSTVRQPATEIGALALKKMVEKLNSPQNSIQMPETILFDTTIQLRNSTTLETTYKY
ncbi:LacI family DNA-binding transcriptional regulator [Flavobacterium limi]|uniref:LacI family transcriptional regulator n=1 Tax=Flavobacterium limi TaxID=2045105 RepID=A0ABQ1UM06_9FLAO|nr:LacI family DNA-binding transcriptional regulator [Flavobacterium limi]GGF22348.1 LacI family transcriptional regulator [Flavobacterium limi]